jgi:predicted Zn-ribbon and HTH transcriptional regulator
MSKFDENLFGRIALFKSYLTPEQLEGCLRIQRSERPPRLLGEILREQGYLTHHQLETILEIRRKKVRKLLRDPKDVREADRSFGELAMECGYLTLDSLESAILEQQRLTLMNLHFRLGEILVSKAYLDIDQVQEILGRQGKRIMLCPSCDSHFNVMGFRRGRLYRCQRCQAELMETRFLDTVAVDGFIDESVAQG